MGACAHVPNVSWQTGLKATQLKSILTEPSLPLYPPTVLLQLYFKLSKLGLLPRNRALIQIKRLIESFLKSRGFSEDQMDDIRTFKTYFLPCPKRCCV